MTQAMDDLTAAVNTIADAISEEIAGLTDEITKLKMQGISATPEDTAGIEAQVAKLTDLANQLKAATPAADTPAPAASPAPAPTAPASTDTPADAPATSAAS